MTSWLLCRESLRFCFMRRVGETWIDLSKIFSREWRKSERIPPNLLPVRFKISFPSIPNSCFSFCYDTIWRADFAELVNITKPILVKFLSWFLFHFLLPTGRPLWFWEGRNFSELTGIGKLTEQLFSGLKILGLKKICTWYSFFTLELYFTYRIWKYVRACLLF